MNRDNRTLSSRLLFCLSLLSLGGVFGCTARNISPISELKLRDAVQRYRATHVEQISEQAAQQIALADWDRRRWSDLPTSLPSAWSTNVSATLDTPFMLGTFALQDDGATSQPVASRPVVPEGYWRINLWHQMGHEAKAFGGHGFWKGFETSFWDLENALVLAATMGASVSIRETGVDHAIRRRTLGHRQLGDFDEPLQLLGHPGTHFAGAGVLWLTSTLMKDEKQHEVAKSLTQALAVNGVSTLLLKASANTRTPDHERHGWPSGHTSSAFTVAAVLNEYYGPLVGIPSLAMAGLVGYQRIDSRVHDFSDVVFGAMLGYIVGSSIARDSKAEFPELFGMKVIPFADPETGTSGIALMKRW